MYSKKEDLYVFNLGSPLPMPVMLFGYALILLSVTYMGDFPILAIIALLLGLYLGFQGQGVEVDMARGKIRSYQSILSVHFGRWLDLNDFPEMTVLRRKTSERIYGGRSANYHEAQKSFYSICILSKSHHTRLVVGNVKGEEDAKSKAKELAEELGRSYVQYNPTISVKSRMKRRRRK